jgi:peptidoglycan/LPS O-acetylase OafA/YrhL
MTSKTFYLSSLDGARAISISFVMIAHLGFEKIVPGGLGVNIFFYISGFLITSLLIKEYQASHDINLKNFYIRRGLRLLPPLFFLVIVTWATAPFTHLFITWKDNVFPAIFYYQNYYELFHPNVNANLGVWSLCIEEHFYAFFPLLFLIFFKSPRKMLIVTIIIIVLATLDRVIISLIYHSNIFAQKYNYAATDTRADSIMTGCLTSLIIHFDVKKIYLRFVSSYLVFFTALAILVLSLVFRGEFYRQTFRYSLQSLMLMVIVPAFIYSDKYKLLNKILSTRFLVWMGKLSYSLYLFHYIGYDFVKNTLHIDSGIKFYLLAPILGFMVASTSFYFVEKPIMRLRTKFGSNVQLQKVN